MKLVSGQKFQWTAARLLHALAAAEKQGVLRDALEALLNPYYNPDFKSDTYDILVWALRRNKKLPRSYKTVAEQAGEEDVQGEAR